MTDNYQDGWYYYNSKNKTLDYMGSYERVMKQGNVGTEEPHYFYRTAPRPEDMLVKAGWYFIEPATGGKFVYFGVVPPYYGTVLRYRFYSAEENDEL